MKIGFECFSENVFISMVKSLKNVNKCDVTNTENTFVYETEKNTELGPYFEQILEVFTPIKYSKDYQYKDAKFIEDYIAEWNIFNVAKSDIKRIIVAICKNSNVENNELFNEKVFIQAIHNTNYMEENCILKGFSWDDFCNDIKFSNRFHTNEVNLEQLGILLKNYAIDIEERSLSLFRSRVCDGEHYLTGYKTDKDIGAPPKDKAAAGRTNSEGIPCLYLADSELTTFHEVRARKFDHVTVGKFTNLEPLRIVDLTEIDSITPFAFEDIDITWFAVNIGIIKRIAAEIAKPMRSFDKLIDYIPTQYIADYVKSQGYDGIKFASTIHEGGVNYAFFDSKKFKCTSKNLQEIKELGYKYNRVTL